jgi:hypothetical protein
MTTRLLAFARENWLLLVIVTVLVVGFIVLHDRPTSLGSTDAFLASLTQGKPTVVTFYSSF